MQLDIDQPPTVFKEAVYQVTGVPPERMKVMVKGGILKVCTIVDSMVMIWSGSYVTIARMITTGRRSLPRRYAYLSGYTGRFTNCLYSA